MTMTDAERGAWIPILGTSLPYPPASRQPNAEKSVNCFRKRMGKQAIKNQKSKIKNQISLMHVFSVWGLFPSLFALTH